MSSLKRLCGFAPILALTMLAKPQQGLGQAVYAATGPGSFISVGITGSGFQQDYGHHYVGGLTLFANANLTRRIGLEAEARDLAAHTDEGVKERTYLVGPRYSLMGRTWRPYVKLLAGRGEFDFPFHDAHGSYFVTAPGAGLDVRVPNSRLTIRVIDAEYQIWPQFTFGALHPYGISSGLSFAVFSPSGYVRGRHF